MSDTTPRDTVRNIARDAGLPVRDAGRDAGPAGAGQGMDRSARVEPDMDRVADRVAMDRVAMAMESPAHEHPVNRSSADNDGRVRALRENNLRARRDLVSKIRELGELGGLKPDPSLLEGLETSGVRETGICYLTVEKLARCGGLVLKKDLALALDNEAHSLKKGEFQELFVSFANRAGWRMRPVEIDRDIHVRTAPMLLAFREDSGLPVVLFPSSNGGKIYDPAEDRTRPLVAGDGAKLSTRGYCFYESFPEGKLDRKKLLAFIFRHSGPTLSLVGIVGLVAAILSLIGPVVTEYVTGRIIPTADYTALKELVILLVILIACQTGFQLVPSLCMLFFGTRQYERFQAAVFDHCLRVPVTTFQMCDAGDMTQRLLGAASIQATVFSVLTGQFLGAIFHLASLAMMFWYSPKLALMGLCLVLVYAGGLCALAHVNLAPLREHAMASGRLTGLMHQFLEGMAKIRSAVAETRVINRIMDEFAVQTRTQFRISRNGAVQSLFSTLFPMLISLLFYALVGGVWRGELDLPGFMAFMAAFQGFQAGLVGVAGGLWPLQAIQPEVERIRPLLEAMPENAEGGEDPGVLDGSVEFSHVSFRYAKDLPLVLDDVSLKIAPGEFVAIVGPSGAGKSTLARLFLGFEHPERGAVLVSGRNLADLDVRAVRRQLGVILQSSKVITASILENINIGTTHTMEDAWLALERAAMADTVRKLPMGIHTVVSPETISGGQQQRILIARALVGSPPLVLMDESTSALDNEAQRTVQSHLEHLGTTRVVIAHRLSTIVNADRIYVLEKGRLVQSGTYEELMRADGLFRRLALRQLTGEHTSAMSAADGTDAADAPHAPDATAGPDGSGAKAAADVADGTDRDTDMDRTLP